MIARIHGTVVEKQLTQVVIDCHGVGYAVMVTVATAESAVLGESLTLATYLAVREDAMQLFGFTRADEREVFLQLLGIPSIGGKTAMGILSATTLGELRSAIATKDVAVLQRLPGIGKKTAERIIVELQDKMSTVYATGESVTERTSDTMQSDAIAAMVALGYQRAKAEKAVRFVVTDTASGSWTTDSILRSALKIIQ
ncbi:MAG: Holliday junction branch migration protein RuvA [Candidatus Kapaibacterium sp.]